MHRPTSYFVPHFKLINVGMGVGGQVLNLPKNFLCFGRAQRFIVLVDRQAPRGWIQLASDHPSRTSPQGETLRLIWYLYRGKMGRITI